MIRLHRDPVVDLACRAFLGAEATQTICLSDAPGATVYRVYPAGFRAVIVKVYDGPTGGKAVKEQRTIRALAAHSTIRTAGVLGCSRFQDATVLMVTDLGDLSMARATRRGMLSRAAALRLLGGLLADFHGIPPAHLRVTDTAAHVAEQVAALRRRCSLGLFARVAPALERTVQLCGTAENLVTCHGDLHPGNVLLWRTGAGLHPHVIDFEQVVRAVPEYDFAQSIVTSGALSDHEQAELAAGYGATLSTELVSALIVFHVMRGWVYAAVRERRDRTLWARRLTVVLDQF